MAAESLVDAIREIARSERVQLATADALGNLASASSPIARVGHAADAAIHAMWDAAARDGFSRASARTALQAAFANGMIDGVVENWPIPADVDGLLFRATLRSKLFSECFDERRRRH